MKSSEWGAVAYLSISQYGYSEGSGNASNEITNNNLGIIDFENISKSPVPNPNNTASWKITAITGYSGIEGKIWQNFMEYTEISDLEDKIIGKGSTSYAWNKCNSGFDKGNGTRSSTTGNIYGIYDFAGCLGNYTASYINSGVKTLITNGGSFATGISNYLSTAYPYNPNPTEDYKDFNSGYNGTGWNEIFGDAIWETSGGFTPETA